MASSEYEKKDSVDFFELIILEFNFAVSLLDQFSIIQFSHFKIQNTYCIKQANYRFWKEPDKNQKLKLNQTILTRDNKPRGKKLNQAWSYGDEMQIWNCLLVS